MQGRLRSVYIAGRAIRFELIYTIERDIQAVTAFVLHDGNFEGSSIRPDRDRLQAAVDADPVLEMHDVPTRSERPRCGGRHPPAKATPPPQGARAAENLVVGEHP